MVNVNQRIHAVTGDLLQIVISRGELPTSELQAIENALVNRLAVCIHRQELDLQNKLLHVLHAVIAALAVVPERRRSASVTSKDGAVAATASEKEAFVRVVADGITRQGNSAVVHHWIDFLLMTVPHFRRSLTDLIEPLVDRLTSRAQDLVFQLRLSYAPATPRAALGSGVTDADFAVVINALERLLIVAVDEGAANPEAEDEAKLIKSPASDGAGFLGGIGGVFGVLGSSDLPASQPAEQKVRADHPGGTSDRLSKADRLFHSGSLHSSSGWSARSRCFSTPGTCRNDSRTISIPTLTTHGATSPRAFASGREKASRSSTVRYPARPSNPLWTTGISDADRRPR